MALQDENVARAFAESLLVDLSSILQAEIGETLPMTWPVIAENQYPAEPYVSNNQSESVATLVQKQLDGEVSATELVAKNLERINTLDPKIKA